MTTITCPNCAHELEVSVRMRPTATSDVGGSLPMRADWTRPFMTFINGRHPGRYTLSEIDRDYRVWAEGQTGVQVPQRHALMRALDSWGYRRYRSASARGFIIDGPRQFVADDETGELRLIKPGSADA
jgi:integrase